MKIIIFLLVSQLSFLLTTANPKLKFYRDDYEDPVNIPDEDEDPVNIPDEDDNVREDPVDIPDENDIDHKDSVNIPDEVDPDDDPVNIPDSSFNSWQLEELKIMMNNGLSEIQKEINNVQNKLLADTDKKIDNLKIEIKHEIGQLHEKIHQINTNNRNEFLKEIKALYTLMFDLQKRFKESGKVVRKLPKINFSSL